MRSAGQYSPNLLKIRHPRTAQPGGSGKHAAAKEVVQQTTQTIIQEQRRLTMVQFQKAEESREKRRDSVG